MPSKEEDQLQSRVDAFQKCGGVISSFLRLQEIEAMTEKEFKLLLQAQNDQP